MGRLLANKIKGKDFSLAEGELAWTSFNKALRVYEYSRAKLNNNRGGLHPTEKPIDLIVGYCKNMRRKSMRQTLQ